MNTNMQHKNRCFVPRSRRAKCATHPLLTALWIMTMTAFPTVTLTACGSGNMFENMVKRSDSDKAKSALESGDVDSAIDILTAYLKEHPEDAAAQSMLANAYLKKSGVDLLKIGTSLSSGGQDQSSWNTISGALPAGTEENISNVQAAVSALSQIPPEDRTDAQNYQLAVAQTTLAITVAKKVAGDSTGTLTTEKIDQMSDSDANTIYNALQGSKDASTAMSTPDSGLSSVSSMTDSISTQEGTTNAERLRNYLKTMR